MMNGTGDVRFSVNLFYEMANPIDNGDFLWY